MTEVCIMVAPNGARRTPSDHPKLPITPKDLAETAQSCRAAGAAALHLHVRDAQMHHSLDPAAYRRAIAAVAAACPGLPIQTTTEAAGVFELEAQIAAAKALRPACLSFALAELMAKGEAQGRGFLDWAEDQGIGIQTILYSPEQIKDYARLQARGVVSDTGPARLLLVAGRYSATQDSTLSDFDALYSALCDTGLSGDALWMTCAFGRGEMACLEASIERGGHVRVGFENAIVDAEGRPARDNAERVALVAELAAKHGCALGDGALARQVLGQSGAAALLP